MGSVPRIARWFHFLSFSLSPFRSLILFSFLQQVKKQVSAVQVSDLRDEGRKIRLWNWQLFLLVRTQGSNGERGSVSFSSCPLPGTALSLCCSHISHTLQYTCLKRLMTDIGTGDSAQRCMINMYADGHDRIDSLLLLLLLLYVCVSVDAWILKCAQRYQKTAFRIYLEKNRTSFLSWELHYCG